MQRGDYKGEVYVFDKELIDKIGVLVEKDLCYVEILFTWQFEKETKVSNRELYDQSFKVFHYAFGVGEEGRSYLWFMLDNCGEEFDEKLFDKSEFSDDEWEFFKKFCMDENEM